MRGAGAPAGLRPVLEKFFKFLDWFIPEEARQDRSDLGLARNFVFTHLFGPLLAQPMSLFLYLTDPERGFACWTIIICIWSFLVLPLALKVVKSLQLVALISVEILAFASLFGAYHYGGVSSPFLPWLIVSLLLGFFYLSDRPVLVIGLFTFNFLGFFAAYALYGFPERVPLSALSIIGWVSIFAATVYMSWMAIYYASMISMRSELEREAERHRTTAVRLQRTKELADKASRAKSIFLAKMSHELRTPLNAVIGYSEILLEDGEIQGKSEEKIADLRRINAAGKHLLSLVTDVLDLSKIESNTMELTISSFDINRFVDEVIATFRPLVDNNRNRLVVNCAERVGTVSTDPTKLRQAVLNLLSNAAKFTKDGVITLTVRRDRKSGGDWIDIQVQDTGIGIAQSDLSKLFQDFGQATAATSKKYGGTGLGLALSQKLCGMMGGSISVQSEPGRGSSFTIRVPAALSVDEHEARAAKAAASGLGLAGPAMPALAG
jgi:signal transduction histidine kinase